MRENSIMISRRTILGGVAMGAAEVPSVSAAPFTGRIPLAVSTYSYWHFKTEKYPIEKVIEHAALLGFDGVEILHRQMVDESPAYCAKLKKMAFERGLSFPMLSIHQDFVTPDAAERQKMIDHTIRCLQLAARLGIPCVRLNS